MKRFNVQNHRVLTVLIILLLLSTGCGGGVAQTLPTETSAPAPSKTPNPTSTPTSILSTLTPTSLPPTAYPLPTLFPSSGTPATFTVCRSGCTFRTIQAAIDQGDGTIIEVRDPIHTEAGITVHKNVIIRGLGADVTTIQAADTLNDAPDRVFVIERGTEVTFEGMTIQHGSPVVEQEKGGGILNYGTLILMECIVTDNIANGGGGISNAGTLTIVNSTIKNNTADGDAPRGQECGNGGGIQSGSGLLLIINSTISGNQGGVKGRARGGGIHIGCGCQAVIINSTISGNHASRQSGRSYAGGHSLGGGIYVAGDLLLIHTTISENRADDLGGGLYILGRLDTMNSLIANNQGDGGECVTTAVEAGTDEIRIGTNLFTFVQDGSCGASFHGNAVLGSLTLNEGTTTTHALLEGSPAIDLIPLAYCPYGTDQRGGARPAPPGADPLFCDIGAFEAQP